MAFATKLRRLDWAGMLLFATVTSFFARSLSWDDAMYPWAPWRTLVPLIIGAALLITLAVYEGRPVQGVFPHRILTSIKSDLGLASGLLNGMAVYLPLIFQAGFPRPPFPATLAALPIYLMYVGFTFIPSVIMELTRRYRLQLCAGWA